jgi:hypothetical protein
MGPRRYEPDAPMSMFTRILLVMLLVVALGGVVFLVTWDIPPPTARIEREIPAERLAQ